MLGAFAKAPDFEVIGPPAVAADFSSGTTRVSNEENGLERSHRRSLLDRVDPGLLGLRLARQSRLLALWVTTWWTVRVSNPLRILQKAAAPWLTAPVKCSAALNLQGGAFLSGRVGPTAGIEPGKMVPLANAGAAL